MKGAVSYAHLPATTQKSLERDHGVKLLTEIIQLGGYSAALVENIDNERKPVMLKQKVERKEQHVEARI